MSAELTVATDDPRNLKTYYFEMTPFRRVITPTVKLVFDLFLMKLTVQNAHLAEISGPVVLAANHMTNFDVYPMQFAMSRPIFFMGKDSLFRNPIVDWGLRQMGGFPVYRGEHDEWAMQHAAEVLEHGQVLGIFPEGKRSKGQGLHTGKSGAARLALAAHCPILPMAVSGTEQLFQRLPRRTEVNIVFGHPIYPEHNESALALTDRMMFALAGLLPPALRGVYAHHPVGF